MMSVLIHYFLLTVSRQESIEVTESWLFFNTLLLNEALGHCIFRAGKKQAWRKQQFNTVLCDNELGYRLH